MALLGTLRDRMGTWVVVFVFVAIAAFILGDIFSGNSNIMNWGRNSVGEIAGKDISIEEFQDAVAEREAYFMSYNRREPSEAEKASLREQAWEMLIAQNAIAPQFEKVGIEVTDQELIDMVSGKNISPGIKQEFMDQQTGEFNRAALNEYIARVKASAPNDPMRSQWQLFERSLKPSRERIKYENLLLKSAYVTKAEAERKYHEETHVAEVRYLYVPYYTLSDTSELSQPELQDYYNKHKERYKTKGSRHLKYVAISIVPSAQDSAEIRENLQRDVDAFRNSQQDSVYASSNSDGETPFAKYSRGTLPDFIKESDLVEGNVIGPVLDGQTYRIVKISKVFTDTVLSARASHILIRSADASETAKAEAKEKARKILAEIKGGADFAAKALEHGTDGTRQAGGDLGWFSSGSMVKAFEDPIFAASKPGLLNDVVETEYGYHIVKVTEVKTNAAYNIAIIEREIAPSDETLNAFYRKAEGFAADLSGISEFERRAREQGLAVREEKNIEAGARRIGALGDARQVVQWLFRDGAIGKVSPVFDVEDQHVVAVMTGEVEEGYRPLEDVKDEITPYVRNERAGKKIIEKLKTLNGTLDEIAKAYGSEANVYSSSDLKLGAPQLPSAGADPGALGLAFSLENGKRSAPYAGENGVLIIELQNKTLAPELNDYSMYKQDLQRNAENFSSMNIANAIKDQAEIEDKRYKFY
jgi:peptidyl-prolyl cis-trans isomerase D